MIAMPLIFLVSCVYFHIVTRPNTDKRRQSKKANKDQENAEAINNEDGVEHDEIDAEAEEDVHDEEVVEIDDLAQLRHFDAGIIAGIVIIIMIVINY
jgi:hypothetical protein